MINYNEIIIIINNNSEMDLLSSLLLKYNYYGSIFNHNNSILHEIRRRLDNDIKIGIIVELDNKYVSYSILYHLNNLNWKHHSYYTYTYKTEFYMNQIRLIERILKSGEITIITYKNKPITKWGEKTNEIRNTYKDAHEICVQVNNPEEFQKMIDLHKEFDFVGSIPTKTGAYYPIFLFYDLKSTRMSYLDKEDDDMIKNIGFHQTLNGVYDKKFTVRDIDIIRKMFEIKKIIPFLDYSSKKNKIDKFKLWESRTLREPVSRFYRIKTKEELKEEFGEKWLYYITDTYCWNPKSMNYLFGMKTQITDYNIDKNVIEFDNKKYVYIPNDPNISNISLNIIVNWMISVDLLKKVSSHPSYGKKEINKNNINEANNNYNESHEIMILIKSLDELYMLSKVLSTVNIIMPNFIIKDYEVNQYETYKNGIVLFIDVIKRSVFKMEYDLFKSYKDIKVHSIFNGVLDRIFTFNEKDIKIILRYIKNSKISNPSYSPKISIKESKSFPIKYPYKEIVVKINNIEDNDILYNFLKKLNINFSDGVFKSNKAFPNYYFLNVNLYHNGYKLSVIRLHDSIIKDRHINEYIYDDPDVDNTIYDTNKLLTIKNIILKGIKSPTYDPKMIIKEARNTSKDANQIVILIKDLNELNIIKELFLKYNLEIPNYIYHEIRQLLNNDINEPLLFYDLKYKDFIHSRLSMLNHIGWESQTLDGIWNKILTINDLKLIDRIIRHNQITGSPSYGKKEITK